MINLSHFAPSPYGRGLGRGYAAQQALSPTLSHRERGQVCWQIDSDLSRVHVIDKNENFCNPKQGRYEICPYKPSFAKVLARMRHLKPFSFNGQTWRCAATPTLKGGGNPKNSPNSLMA
ncbi:hypothetical protein [Alysiella filiformis]|uniref:hypothetical protein n=1 Tax=Alysiella filiformis TaxID=194196 RepID=UPI0015F40DC4|nr:hypothetical protein [Alysiella filiformis]QMT31921.1 hypothetical protein H3L97_03320 [Alysiella filiformis]UBQ57172.1 hypothetical protein JF568_05355 [Alysiella filiformis DSM 16848]